MPPIGGVRASYLSAGKDAIPDSAVAQYSAQKLSGISDGGTVNTRPDQVDNSPDLTGTGTFRVSSFNGYDSIYYNQSNSDEHTATGQTISQKVVIFAVVNSDFTSSTSNYKTVVSHLSSDMTLAFSSKNSAWEIYAGNKPVNGTSDVDISLLTAVFDGLNSLIREDGNQQGSGDAGSSDFTLASIGHRASLSDRYFNGEIPFVEIHDGAVSNGLQTREQEIADMWDITL